MSTQLTTNFSLELLYHSELAIRNGFTNMPSPEIIGHLLLVAQGLEKIQILLGHPLNICSAYHSPKLNALLNGSSTSPHLEGYAVNFTCWNYGKPSEIVEKIATSDIEFDECWHEGTWVRISFHPKLRHSIQTALFDNKGQVRYLDGI